MITSRPLLLALLAALAICEQAAAEPQVLAHQLALLMDGAIVAAMVSRDPAMADTAGLAAASLLAPVKPKKPKRASEAPAQLMAV